MNVSHIFATSPPIAENIFKHLRGRDLSACAQVCSLWNRVAQSEQRRRQDVTWFFQGRHCMMHNKIHASCGECSKYYYIDMETDLHKQLDGIRLHPVFSIIFVSNRLIDKEIQLEYPRTYNLNYGFDCQVIKKVRRYLPQQCDVSFCVAPRIVGCCQDAVPLQIRGPAIAGFLLPKFDGFEVYRFSVGDLFYTKFTDLIPKEKTIKCLLVFPTSLANEMIQNCTLKDDGKVAVGGAIVDRTQSLFGSGLAICGPHVEAASVIITPEDEEDELENKLRLFQDAGLLKYRCFAFMFSCVLQDFYKFTFHKMYPRVPLIGLLGNIGIGVNYFPHLPTKNEVFIDNLASFNRKYLLGHSAVFVLVSVKM